MVFPLVISKYYVALWTSVMAMLPTRTTLETRGRCLDRIALSNSILISHVYPRQIRNIYLLGQAEIDFVVLWVKFFLTLYALDSRYSTMTFGKKIQIRHNHKGERCENKTNSQPLPKEINKEQLCSYNTFSKAIHLPR